MCVGGETFIDILIDSFICFIPVDFILQRWPKTSTWPARLGYNNHLHALFPPLPTHSHAHTHMHTLHTHSPLHTHTHITLVHTSTPPSHTPTYPTHTLTLNTPPHTHTHTDLTLTHPITHLYTHTHTHTHTMPHPHPSTTVPSSSKESFQLYLNGQGWVMASSNVSVSCMPNGHATISVYQILYEALYYYYSGPWASKEGSYHSF